VSWKAGLLATCSNTIFTVIEIPLNKTTYTVHLRPETTKCGEA